MARIELTTPVTRIIHGKMYSTKAAAVAAHDSFSGAVRGDHLGRTQILYKTKKGDFFVFFETSREDELDHLEPVSYEETRALYDQLLCPEMDYDEAFGDEPEEE